MVLKKVSQEFQSKKLWYRYHDPSAFWRYQWISWDLEYVGIRVSLAVYAVLTWFSSVTGIWHPLRPWYVYLNMWTFTVLTVHLVLAAVLAVGFTLRTESGDQVPEPLTQASSKRDNPLAWYLKLSWLLGDIITPVAPVVTLIYLGGLCTGGPTDYFNGKVHIVTMALVAVDQFTTARPIRLLHSVAPMVFGLVYCLFNFTYWALDPVGHILYPGVVSWSHLARTLWEVFVLNFLLIPLFVFIAFLVYRLKLEIYAWRYGTRQRLIAKPE